MSLLHVRYVKSNDEHNAYPVPGCRNGILPFAAGPVYTAGFKYMDKLTQGDDVQTVYKLGLELEKGWEYAPGDTIGIIVSNRGLLVERLLQRLNLETQSDMVCEITVDTSFVKIGRKSTRPKHIPSWTTLRKIFLHYVDIQSPPKKLFLRDLATHTTDNSEQEQMIFFCTAKGCKAYSEFIQGPGRTLLGLLEHFPSCRPPIEVLLEHLPPLLPRPYSISSAPCRKDVLEITFSVATHENGGRGLCTGWLEDLPTKNKLERVVPFYVRQPSTSFRLDDFSSGYVILIATGTGIAPFHGFLEQLHLCKKQSRLEIWLIYGCRHPDKDFLYKEDIDEYRKSRVLTRFDVAFSAIEDEESAGCEKTDRYVQDVIRNKAEEVSRWILSCRAQVFICGNPAMVGDVKKALVRVFADCGAMLPIDAEDYVTNMTKTKRCNVDSWS